MKGQAECADKDAVGLLHDGCRRGLFRDAQVQYAPQSYLCVKTTWNEKEMSVEVRVRFHNLRQCFNKPFSQNTVLGKRI